MTGRLSLRDFSLNGSTALEFILKESPYGSLAQAVASLALFTHPATVAQTQAQALFRIVRGPIPQRGHIVSFHDGRSVLLDDNTGPTVVVSGYPRKNGSDEKWRNCRLGSRCNCSGAADKIRKSETSIVAAPYTARNRGMTSKGRALRNRQHR